MAASDHPAPGVAAGPGGPAAKAEAIPDGLSAPLRIGPEALSGAARLVEEAGWNQVAADWSHFFARGEVFGAQAPDGRLAATAAVLPYDGFAWVSMVIVARDLRGAGLGTVMLRRCLAALRERATVGVLDATPAGERVYRPLGFRPIFGLRRWQGRGGAVTDPARPRDPGLRPEGLLELAVELDAGVFGARRDALLADFWRRPDTLGFACPGGVALLRQGRIAAQIGPIVAGCEEDARALLARAVAAARGPVFLDVPERWSGLAAWLSGAGFTVQRPYLRMALGRDAAWGDPGRMFVIAGPEFG